MSGAGCSNRSEMADRGTYSGGLASLPSDQLTSRWPGSRLDHKVLNCTPSAMPRPVISALAHVAPPSFGLFSSFRYLIPFFLDPM